MRKCIKFCGKLEVADATLDWGGFDPALKKAVMAKRVERNGDQKTNLRGMVFIGLSIAACEYRVDQPETVPGNLSNNFIALQPRSGDERYRLRVQSVHDARANKKLIPWESFTHDGLALFKLIINGPLLTMLMAVPLHASLLASA